MYNCLSLDIILYCGFRSSLNPSESSIQHVSIESLLPHHISLDRKNQNVINQIYINIHFPRMELYQ